MSIIKLVTLIADTKVYRDILVQRDKNIFLKMVCTFLLHLTNYYVLSTLEQFSRAHYSNES